MGITKNPKYITKRNTMVQYIETVAQYEEHLKSDKLVVIDFTATWCGPCQFIAPKYEAMSDEHKDVLFLKCDFDKASDVSQKCGIQCMPTFKYYKGGQEVDKLEGASEQKLKDLVAKHK